MISQKGQSLIEIIISLTVIVAIVTAISYTVTNSLKNSQYAKNQTLATQYAQDGMDIIRNMRYTDYAAFSSLPAGSYCLADTCSGISGQNGVCGPASNATNPCITTPNLPSSGPFFIRQVNIQPNAVACSQAGGLSGTQVTVSVAWTDGQCQNGLTFCHIVAPVSCITNYDVINSP